MQNSKLIQEQLESLLKLKNDLSINGSLYTIDEVASIINLAEDIKTIAESNVTYGNFNYPVASGLNLR